MNIFLSLILGIVTTLTGYGFYTDTTPREMVDALGSTMTGSAWFLNASQQIQAGASTWGLRIPSLSSSGDCLTTDASGVVSTSACGSGSGSSNWTILSGGLRTSTSTDFAQASHFIATSTTATSSFAGAVGIGTTNPLSKFYLSGTASSSVFTIADSVAGTNMSGAIDFSEGNYAMGADSLSRGFRIAHDGVNNSLSFNGVNTGLAFAPIMTLRRGTNRVGIGTTSPYANLTVEGSFGLTGAFFDRTASVGTNGMILKTTSTGVEWVAASTLGLGQSNWLFNGSRLTPSTTVGIGVFASSTIGGGTGATGLTISGGATTTEQLNAGTTTVYSIIKSGIILPKGCNQITGDCLPYQSHYQSTSTSAIGNNTYASNGALFSKNSGVSSKALRRSTDEGVSWSTIYTFTNDIQNVLMTASGTILVSTDNDSFAAPAGEIFRSTDNGSTFTLVHTLTSGAAVYWSMAQTDSAIFVGEYGQYPSRNVYRSTDDGATWSTVYTDAGVGSKHIHGIATDPTDNNAVMFVTGDDTDELLYSSNGGASFTTITGSFDQMTKVIFKSPYVFLFTDEGNGKIYRTTKTQLAANSVVLEEVFRGRTRTEGDYLGQFYSATVDHCGRIYAGTLDENNASFGNGGIFVSPDNGESWQLIKDYPKTGVTAGPFLMSDGRAGINKIFVNGTQEHGVITPALCDTGVIGSEGQIQFSDGVGGAAAANSLLWDNTNSRLGIGTSTPIASLHVGEGTDSSLASGLVGYFTNNGTAAVSVRDSTANTEVQMVAYTGNAAIGTVSNTPLTFRTSNSTKMIIASDGKVGIGTTTPSRLLTVQGDGYFLNNITAASATIAYASSTGISGTNLDFTNATGTNMYGFGLSTCNGVGQALTWISGKYGCGTITASGDGVSNWLFNGSRLTPSTTVGIGVFASSTIGDGTGAGGLTINGGATTTGTLRVGAPFTNESGELRVNGSVFASDSFNIPGLTKLSLGSLYNAGTFNLVGYNGTSPVNLLNTQGAGTTGIGVNFPSGNVGIGTTSPSRLLTVQGDGYFLNNITAASATIAYASTTGISGSNLNFTNATSTTSFFSALGTFTNMVVNTLATFLNVVVTGLLDIGDGVLEIPNGTAPVADDPGELAFDTTDNMLIIDDFAIPTKPTLFAWSHGSTSPKFATSTTWYVPTVEDGYVVTDINCKVTGGTSKVLTIYGETLTCDADGAVDDGTITIATVGAGSTTVAYTMGAGVGNVNDIIITVSGRITRE